MSTTLAEILQSQEHPTDLEIALDATVSPEMRALAFKRYEERKWVQAVLDGGLSPRSLDPAMLRRIEPALIAAGRLPVPPVG